MCVFLQMTSRILSAQPSAITYLRLKLLTNARHQRPTPNFDKRCMWQHRIFLRDCRLVFLFPCLSISLSLPFMRESLPYCCPGDRWLTYSERQDTCYLGFCPAGLAIPLAYRGPSLCTHAHCWKGQQVSTENAGPRDGSIWPQAARGQGEPQWLTICFILWRGVLGQAFVWQWILWKKMTLLLCCVTLSFLR